MNQSLASDVTQQSRCVLLVPLAALRAYPPDLPVPAIGYKLVRGGIRFTGGAGPVDAADVLRAGRIYAAAASEAEQEALRSALGVQASGCRFVAAEQPAAILAALIADVDRTLHAQADLVSRQARELALLRTQQDTLQRDFSALEAVFVSKRLQPVHLAFENPPAAGMDGVSILDAGGGYVEQLLPVGSVGVSAVALYVQSAPRTGLATFLNLHVQLWTVEALRLVEEWTLPLGELRTGWNQFQLSRALSGLRRSLKLVVRSDSRRDAPRLALGANQPLSPYRVAGQGGESLIARSLAVRVWQGLPGTQSIIAATSTWPKGDASRAMPGVEVDVAIEAAEVISAELRQSLSFEAVHVSPEERRVVLHPAPHGNMILKVGAGTTTQAGRISVDVVLVDARAEATDFGLLALPASRSAGLSEIEDIVGQDVPSESWSGWRTLQGMTSSQLHLFRTGTPHREPLDIHLLTRAHVPGRCDFAHARFEFLRAFVPDVVPAAI